MKLVKEKQTQTFSETQKMNIHRHVCLLLTHIKCLNNELFETKSVSLIPAFRQF